MRDFSYRTILPAIVSQNCFVLVFAERSATTQNLVVKFDGEFCSGVLVENVLDNFPSKRSSKSPSKLHRKFTTNFAENFANFTLESAGAYNYGKEPAQYKN